VVLAGGHFDCSCMFLVDPVFESNYHMLSLISNMPPLPTSTQG
jgi:hypothetical protein